LQGRGTGATGGITKPFGPVKILGAVEGDLTGAQLRIVATWARWALISARVKGFDIRVTRRYRWQRSMAC